MDIVILDTIASHTLVYIGDGDPTCRALMERAIMQNLVAYRDHTCKTKYVPLALETCGALFDKSGILQVECATSASRKYAELGLSVSLLFTWFRWRESIALQRSLAHAIHAKTSHVNQILSLLPSPQPSNLLTFAELRIFAKFV